MAKREPKNRLTGSTGNRESLAPFTGKGWPLAVIYSRHEMRQIPRLAVAGMVAAGFLGGCSPSSAGQLPPGPNGYPPAAEQSLNFQGALNAQVTTAYPSSCGAGTGPGGELFSFAAYFQSQGTWYLVKFETDYVSRQYKGPGTYTVPAAIYPRALDGSADPRYSGSVQLTVSGYRGPGWAGSVSGTLDWTGSTTEQAQVKISGGWTCTPGPMTGPG
jgi:hypothetical protein